MLSIAVERGSIRPAPVGARGALLSADLCSKHCFDDAIGDDQNEPAGWT